MKKIISNGKFVFIFSLSISPIYIYLSLSGVIHELYLSALFISSILITIFLDKAETINKYITHESNRTLVVSSLLFATYIITTQLLHLANGDKYDNIGRSLFFFNLQNTGYNIIWLICGIYFGRLIAKKNKDNTIIACWIATTFFYAFNFDASSWSIDISKNPTEIRSITLLLSDIYAVLSIIAVGKAKGELRAAIITISSMAILFTLQSRSSLAFAFIAILAGKVLLSNIKTKSIYITAILLTPILLASISNKLLEINERMVSIFISLSSDQSFIERTIQFKYGFLHISDSPLWGSYGRIVTDLGSHGAYMHNILSFWQVYGLPGFVFAILALIYTPARIISKSLIPEHVKQTCLMLFIYISLQLLLSRSYTYNFSWMLLGLITYLRVIFLSSLARERAAEKIEHSTFLKNTPCITTIKKYS